jgi:hypothetical protein
MRLRGLAALALVSIVACGDSATGGGFLNPTQLSLVAGSGQTGTVGVAFAAPLVAEVRANDSTIIPAFRVDFRISSGSATLNPPSTVTDANGHATTVVTPTAPGTIVVSATVFSSSLTDDFLLSAVGPASDPCAGPVTGLAIAQIDKTLGGSGLCLGGGLSGADYAIVAFNSDTILGASATVRLTGTGLAAPPASSVPAALSVPARGAVRSAPRAGPSADRSAFWQRADAARRWADARSRFSAVVLDTVGQRRLINVNFADDCANPIMRVGRVVAVSPASIVVVDSLAPAGSVPAPTIQALSAAFDSLAEPAVRLNFREPFDVDSNGKRTVLFITPAVNALPAMPGFLAPDVVFRSRDLYPKVAGDSLPPPCVVTNAAELLYVALPDSAGTIGAPRTSTQLVHRWPRVLAHEYQHLVNASRRLYVVRASALESPWLDEALSQAAEELVFLRMASRNSRENLGAFELQLTNETMHALDVAQQVNIDNARAFLANPGAVSLLDAVTNPASRGAAWMLVRYLVDHAPPPDYNSWTALGSTAHTGLTSLRLIFGPSLPIQIRGWATSIYTDDLFATEPALQEPTWSFRSVYPDLYQIPFPLATVPLISGVATDATISSLSAAYFRLSVPAGATASVTWSAATAGPIAPTVRWTLVRTR